GRLDGHQPAPDIGARAGDGEAEANLGDLARETPDARRQPRGAHRHRTHVDGEGAWIAHDADGLQDAVDVGEGLAHALEHDAVDALPGDQGPAEQAHLLDDLPALQVAREAG